MKRQVAVEHVIRGEDGRELGRVAVVRGLWSRRRRGGDLHPAPMAAHRFLDVPHFDQRQNANEPGATCGITAAAMVINHFQPWHTTPDQLYVAHGKAAGQSPEGIASLLTQRGLHATPQRGGTRAQIRAHLDAGRPVIVHGFWTGAGHIAVIVGYDEHDWIVNDPAGDWESGYGNGGGHRVRYARGGAWDAKLSVDGDVWMTSASRAAF